jgi:hypothetical protein
MTELKKELLFSKRLKLSEIIDKWMTENGYEYCISNAISFLQTNGMLNTENAIKYLEEHDRT